MDYHRAEEILNSEETIEVLYNKKPVWINNLDPHKKTAQLTDSDQKSIDIPVQDLIEGDKLE